MLDTADRLLNRAFNALLALDEWAIKAVGNVGGERVLPAVDRAVKQLLRWRTDGRR